MKTQSRDKTLSPNIAAKRRHCRQWCRLYFERKKSKEKIKGKNQRKKIDTDFTKLTKVYVNKILERQKNSTHKMMYFPAKLMYLLIVFIPPSEYLGDSWDCQWSANATVRASSCTFMHPTLTLDKFWSRENCASFSYLTVAISTCCSLLFVRGKKLRLILVTIVLLKRRKKNEFH